jgi:nucleobase:cation symporter-1, NCS1 family
MPTPDQVDPDLTAQDGRRGDAPTGHHLHFPHHDHPDPILHAPPAEASAFVDLPPISERLYNQDLAPTKAAGRRWSGYNIFALWANDVHSLGNYGFAWVCSPWVWAAGRSCSRWESAPAYCSCC